jgi:hypothetical protein
MGRRYTTRSITDNIELVPVCPRCRASVYWSLHSGLEGAQSYAHCANNMSATRIILKPGEMMSCDWEGIVVRNKNGTVDIFNIDGSAVPYRVVKHDQ